MSATFIQSIFHRRVALILINRGVVSVVLCHNWFMGNFVNFWLPGIQHDVIAVPADYAGFLASIFAPVRMGWTAAVSDAVEPLTGNAPCTLEAWIAEHQAVLASQG